MGYLLASTTQNLRWAVYHMVDEASAPHLIGNVVELVSDAYGTEPEIGLGLFTTKDEAFEAFIERHEADALLPYAERFYKGWVL